MIEVRGLALLLCALLLGITACGSQPPAETPSGQPSPPARYAQLTPFAPATTTPAPVQVTPTEIPPVPTPTPTPRTHTVQQGEDMFGIALRYGVGLDELRTANPTVQPNFLSIGTVLIIPGTAVPELEPTAPGTLYTPTAAALEIGTLACYSTGEGGAWCFQPVRNPHDRPLESVSAIFRLGDEAGQEIAAQAAHLPLDLLPPGATLPLSAFFSPPLPPNYRASAELVRALPNPSDGRYLPTRIENQVVVLAEGGLSAEVSGDVFLEDPAAAAQRVWVAAVAYDGQGSVVGVRRWENPSGSSLQGDQPLSARIMLYSAVGPIARVELISEARP